VRRNGYIYIYLSNESAQDVYFDNLVVNLKHGPLLEVKNYYAFGIENPALSTKALKSSYYENRIKYNGRELQNKEFTDGTGLEAYDYGARMYDPQIARITTLDPKAELNRKWSTYVYCADNPIRNIDPDGMEWKDPKKDAKIAEHLQGEIAKKIKTETGNQKDAQGDAAKIQAKIDKIGSTEKLQNKLNAANAKIAQIKKTISNLEASSAEIGEMGTTKNQKFTFKDLAPGQEVGKTEKDADGTIVMTVGSQDGNRIHEAFHGYQQFKGTESKDTYTREEAAYARQYAFDGNGMNTTVPSWGGSVESYEQITNLWLLGIHDSNGRLIYAPDTWTKETINYLKTQQ
jgi:RHS repeat-associated protein